MEIIPHPIILKEKEKELMEIESNLSYRLCEIYSLEISLRERIEKIKKRERNIFLVSFSLFIMGFLLGHLLNF